MSRPVRVKDLPQSTLGTGVHLYCPTCHEHYSATAGDYFMLPLEQVMRCGNDNTRLQLTRTVSREVEV